MPFFFILSLRQVGHLISRVIRISLFYQNPTCFFSAYFLKHHQLSKCLGKLPAESNQVSLKIFRILMDAIWKLILRGLTFACWAIYLIWYFGWSTRLCNKLAVALQSWKTTPSQQRKASSNGCLTSTFNFGYLWEDYHTIMLWLKRWMAYKKQRWLNI